MPSLNDLIGALLKQTGQIAHSNASFVGRDAGVLAFDMSVRATSVSDIGGGHDTNPRDFMVSTVFRISSKFRFIVYKLSMFRLWSFLLSL